jgi:hypothetical protein
MSADETPEIYEGDEEKEWTYTEDEYGTFKKTKAGKIKKPPYELEEDTTEHREQNRTEKSLKQSWNEVLESLKDLDDPVQLNMLLSVLKPAIANLKEIKKPAKHPYAYQEKYAKPPEETTKKLIEASNFSPNAELLLEFMRKGYKANEIPSELLRKMDARDFMIAEKLLKEEVRISQPPRTLRSEPQLLPDWSEIHRWKKKTTGRP